MSAYHERIRAIDNAADSAVAMVAPVDWFDDNHDPKAPTPRCCEAVACVAAALAVIGVWPCEDTLDLARTTVKGMDEACA